ncbi:hypothetical protein CK224_04810 [Mesorhizobium sp. WSM3862]|nr:hypothetical protein CK224_04810 [Mesorhizobium sp. WSM3862]
MQLQRTSLVSRCTDLHKTQRRSWRKVYALAGDGCRRLKNIGVQIPPSVGSVIAFGFLLAPLGWRALWD